MPFSVWRIPGSNYGRYRQDVVFLECPEDAEVNGRTVFDALKEKQRTDMLNRFDLWQQGMQHVDKYFHGFNAAADRECFVFKLKVAGTYHRFYGFLISPRPVSDARYRLCVLTSHARKSQENTDPSELNLVNKIRVKPEVIAAVKKEFPEAPGGPNATLHSRR